MTYLNASLNNITAIENLDGCELLEKLDLTGNFVDVESMEKSMENLSKNERLRSLFLVGNPCMEEFERMREYVISRLPRLVFLDVERLRRRRDGNAKGTRMSSRGHWKRRSKRRRRKE